MPYVQDAVGKFPRFEPRIKSVTLGQDTLSTCERLREHLKKANIIANVKQNAQHGCTVYYEEARERAVRSALVDYK